MRQMNPHPFYRSLLFWLGLPGLVFLLWGWWDSGAHGTDLMWTRPNQSVEIHVFLGRLELMSTRDQIQTGHSPRLSRWHVTHDALQDEGGSFLQPHFFFAGAFHPISYSSADKWEGGVDPFDSPVAETRGGIVALWLLLLTYAVGWLAAVTIWQRRKARLLKLHSPP